LFGRWFTIGVPALRPSLLGPLCFASVLHSTMPYSVPVSGLPSIPICIPRIHIDACGMSVRISLYTRNRAYTIHLLDPHTHMYAVHLIDPHTTDKCGTSVRPPHTDACGTSVRTSLYTRNIVYTRYIHDSH